MIRTWIKHICKSSRNAAMLACISALLLFALPTPVIALANADQPSQLQSNGHAETDKLKPDSEKSHGSLWFERNAYAVKEKHGSIEIKVVRVGGTAGQVSASYCFCDANATKDTDYEAVAGIITFDDGEKSKTISIRIINDTIKEQKEMFKLFLKSPSGGAKIGLLNVAWVIIDDDDDKK